MKREDMLQRLAASEEPWDIVIIGGGATGLGCAVDATARGYRTVLLESHDFAHGTSSRSTKLIHGGVRYLQRGNLRLVVDALRERGRLTRNAPHLVQKRAFVIPSYKWWDNSFYWCGLRRYGLLAGKENLAPSRHLNIADTLSMAPTLQPRGLRGGTLYYDGQFDDARLAIALAQTAAGLGGVLLNYYQLPRSSRRAGWCVAYRTRSLLWR